MFYAVIVTLYSKLRAECLCTVSRKVMKNASVVWRMIIERCDPSSCHKRTYQTPVYTSFDCYFNAFSVSKIGLQKHERAHRCCVPFSGPCPINFLPHTKTIIFVAVCGSFFLVWSTDSQNRLQNVFFMMFICFYDTRNGRSSRSYNVLHSGRANCCV